MEDVEELFKAKNSKEYQDGYLDGLSDVLGILSELPENAQLIKVKDNIRAVIIGGDD